MNPIIRKELHLHMRMRRGWWLLGLYLFALCGTVTLVYYNSAMNARRGNPVGAVVGTNVFHTVVLTQLVVLLFLAPVFSAGSLTIEKEQRTLAGLLTSLLSPFEIWWGKYAASLLYLGLLLFSSLPILSVAVVLGGIGPLEVLAAFGVTALLLASICSIGLYFSSFFRRSVHSTALTYGLLLATHILSFVAFAFLEPSLAEAGFSWKKMPLLLNTFSCMMSVLGIEDFGWKWIWLASLLSFAALGVTASLLASRNLRRSEG